MKSIGKLKTYKSSEITKSRVSIGFECMDRGLINPDKCYVPLAESGIKYARVQTGWAICEKEKGKYDWTWLDGIVNKLHMAINLAAAGQDPAMAAQEMSCSGDCGSCGGCH